MTSDQTTRLFLAIALIVLLAFAAGALARRFRQPPVIGEVLVGVLLGPTLLTASVSNAIFPSDIRPYLSALASIGVALFMFTVGAEMNAGLLRGRQITAGSIALGSIILPFSLGAVLALYLFTEHPTENKTAFVLFMGAAMSVSAFPVLARILSDRGMSRTWIGNLTLACAAIDDVAAWSLLAVVVIVAGGAVQWLTLLFIPYLVIMVLLARPVLRRVLNHPRILQQGPSVALVITLVGLLASAAFTEWIGLQFIFGAFLFGAVMPRERTPVSAQGFAADTTDQISRLNTLLLLPIFFIVAGLKVNLSGMDGTDVLELVLILVVAVGGKFLGAYVGARLSGLPSRQASIAAILINTRGLTELIILGVGLELGVLDTDLYSLMVVMALVTTAMAGPLLARLYPLPATTGEGAMINTGDEASVAPDATARSGEKQSVPRRPGGLDQ